MGEHSIHSSAVRSLSILTPLEQQVAVEFARRVRERMADRIRDMKVYGSRARREAREDSDLDVLVLLDKAPLCDRKAISDIGTDIMLEMLLPFQVAPRVMSQQDYDQLRSLERLFPAEIERDGIVLLREAQDGYVMKIDADDIKIDADYISKSIDEINDLCYSSQFREALTRLDRLLGENHGLRFSSYFLVKRSDLIQLQDEMDESVYTENEWDLKDAEKNLRDAVKVDPSSLEALIELGNFTYVFNDDKNEALNCFEKAIEKCNDFLEKALLGKIKCILEMEGPKKAMKLLKKAEKQFPDSNRFVDVRSDILQRLK